jgi:uncharacterized protein DUF4129
MAEPPPHRPLSGARTALAVGAAGLAFGLVSLATRAGSSSPGAPPGWHVAGTVGRHAAAGLGLALAPVVLVLGLAVWLAAGFVARQKRAEQELQDPAARRKRLIRYAVVFATAALVLALVRAGVVNVHRLHLHVPGSSPTSSRGHPRAAGQGGSSGVDLAVAAGLWAALALAIGVAVLRWRSRRAAPPAPALPAAAPEAGIDFGALRALADPREAVIRSYAAMEATLDARALGRDPAEGPREFLARVGGRLRRSRAAARRLTGLYEGARFSDHPVDSRMQASAVDALEVVDADREEPA